MDNSPALLLPTRNPAPGVNSDQLSMGGAGLLSSGFFSSCELLCACPVPAGPLGREPVSIETAAGAAGIPGEAGAGGEKKGVKLSTR
jgi:hypothetical protein